MQKKVIYLLLGFVVIGFLSSCGTSMAFKKGQENIVIKENSYVLMSVRLSNKHNTSYQPQARSFYVNGSKESPTFNFDYPISSVANQYNEYLVSLPLKPGKYTLDKIFFYASTFMIKAQGDAKLNIVYDVKPNTVVYAGRIVATIRERKYNEVPAGGIFPLIDQAVAGISNGAFDIEIIDNYDADMMVFIKEFPGLQKMTIEKTIMGPWVRPLLQKNPQASDE